MIGNPSYVAFIDESGDEGFSFASGSSEWFVLAAVILRRSVELQEVKLIDEVRSRLNQGRKPEHLIPPRKPLHFRDIKHEPRKFYANRIAQADLRTVAVMVNKPSLSAPEVFATESRLYHYSVRLLAERVSWYCRDHHRPDHDGDGSVELVFSNRSTLDCAKISAYMRYLEENREALQYRAAEGVIRPEQVVTYSHGRRMGLQVADAVATSYFYAVEPSPYGFVEDSYARLILPKAYRYKSSLWGYGIKLMPKEAEERRRQKQILVGW